VLNFNHGRQDLSLFYVAASRVRRIEDLMFEDSFDFDRINGGETNLAIMRRIDWDRRSLQRLIASNKATSSDLRRQGPSQLPSTGPFHGPATVAGGMIHLFD
jgi:hypothetical protein